MVSRGIRDARSWPGWPKTQGQPARIRDFAALIPNARTFKRFDVPRRQLYFEERSDKRVPVASRNSVGVRSHGFDERDAGSTANANSPGSERKFPRSLPKSLHCEYNGHTFAECDRPIGIESSRKPSPRGGKGGGEGLRFQLSAPPLSSSAVP